MAAAEPLFDPSLKKKKKKTVAFNEDPLGADADPTAPAPETIDNTTLNGDAVDLGPTTAHERMKSAEDGPEKKTEEDEFKALFGDLKKKKKKKEIPMDLGEGDSGAATPAGGDSTSGPTITADDLDFSDMKKKKKSSKKKTAFDLEAFEKELNDTSETKVKSGGADSAAVEEEDEGEGPTDTTHLDIVDETELGENPFANAHAAEGPVGIDAGNEAWLKSDRDYTYLELLTRFYAQLHAANPSLLSSTAGKRYTIAPPSIHREGNKKTIFANISDICKRMHRQPEHVIQYLFSEMGTTGSVDGSSRLVIKGRFQQKQVENVLRRYIVEYVTCKTCKSPDTLLSKENRIFFIACESCGSRRSVNTIKSGFQAQVGKRSKNKTG
ncbi:translation initiation factor [Amanita muscaria]